MSASFVVPIQGLLQYIRRPAYACVGYMMQGQITQRRVCETLMPVKRRTLDQTLSETSTGNFLPFRL